MASNGTRFKLLIKQSGLSYEEISERTGISVRSITSYANGTRSIANCTLRAAAALASVLNVTMEDLLYSAEELGSEYANKRISYTRSFPPGLIQAISVDGKKIEDITKIPENTIVNLHVYREPDARTYTFLETRPTKESPIGEWIFEDATGREVSALLNEAPWYYRNDSIIYRDDLNHRYTLIINNKKTGGDTD